MDQFHYWPLYAANALGLIPKKRNFWSIIRAFITIFLIASVGFGCILELAWNWKGIETPVKVLPSFTLVLQILVKIYVFVTKYKLIQEVINDIQMFLYIKEENPESEEILKSTKKSAKYYLKLYTSMLYISGTIYNFGPYFIKSFPYVCYQPELFKETLYYNIAYLWQLISSYVIMVHVAFSFDLLLISLVAHVHCELKLIKHRIESLKDDDGYVIVSQNFSKLIRSHNFVLEFISKMNNMYTNMLLWQFLSSFLALYNGAFSFLLYRNLSEFVSFIGSVLIQLLIYCICGALIIEQTGSVGEALFGSTWWIGFPKMKNDVSIVIRRSQQKSQLNVGKFVALDLESFISVLKASYSLFTLMQTMYSNEK